MPARGQITERSFYPSLIKVISGKGGSGVSEVRFNSQPDIVFDLDNIRWLLSVKIGESPATLKSAFVQYQRHKDESKLNHGLIVFLPESVQKLRPIEASIDNAISSKNIGCLIDMPNLKEEYSDAPFPTVIDRLKVEVIPRYRRREEKPYSLNLIVRFLQQHVTELMELIPPEDPSILKAITDKDLLSGIGNLDSKQAKVATQFLGASILLSQIMFLRLYGASHPEILPPPPSSSLTRKKLRTSFRQIWNINYRPIYDLDVLDAVSEDYLRETFDLINGLEIEKSRYELPGRLFHALMPKPIRKLMAAFYTRPQSADILARLSIRNASDTVFDPASGSGTILVSAYRTKLELSGGISGDELHRKFCQEEIFGADIMPFAVHLSTANLAAMDPSTTIKRTQIMHGDSLELSIGTAYSGFQQKLFPTVAKAKTMKGTEYRVDLKKVKVILMNPPFTKVERGIQQFVDMDRFRDQVGSEVGLWGHFIPLADQFLEANGIIGAVLPVSTLRGRETQKVRNFLFSKMKPLFILKTTLNYGFSESSEYRDVLFIAEKTPPRPEHRVKFCLLKFDINESTWEYAHELAKQILTMDNLRSEKLDIESFAIGELTQSMNLMPYMGVTDYRHRDMLLAFTARFDPHFTDFPPDYVKEGLRFEGKVSSVALFTRSLHPSRLEEAFLGFDKEDSRSITAKSLKGVEYHIERQALVPSLRTGVGQNMLSLEGRWDYLAVRRYEAFPRVLRATGVKAPCGETWAQYFNKLCQETKGLETSLVVVRRVNPYSPNVHLLSFYSRTPLFPADQLKVIDEKNETTGKAVCTLLNSCLFLVKLFLFKEETTGRYIDIRSYDLYQVKLFPSTSDIQEKLSKVFSEFAQRQFPSLREQLDINFLSDYESFWEKKAWPQGFVAQPSPIRLEFDRAVVKALGKDITDSELHEIYTTIVKEMIITRGLTRD